MSRIRLIPATIATASVLLAVKVADVIRGTEQLIPTVEAQQTEPATSTPAAAPASAAATATADTSKKEAKPAEKKEEKKEEGKTGEKKNPAISDAAGDTVDQHYSAVEVELLQNLAKRREELDRWEQNIKVKEDMLDATEKRIDDKIAQVTAMKKEVADLLAQYNDIEDAKIRSLVKIYENMKPQDAARIFNELDMPVLLLVVDKMSEKKVAPILAGMDSQKAKQITVELAEERRVNSNKFTPPGATPPQPQTTTP